MKWIHVLVEGPTEEAFVGQVLAPHLSAWGLHPSAKVIITKRVKSGPAFKGGAVSYGKIKNDLRRLLSDKSATVVTTMLDFYRLPRDFPKPSDASRGSCYERVARFEKAFRQDIHHRRFLPYLSLHEFEALIFADPAKISSAFPGTGVHQAIWAIREKFASPEEINDKNPPSKRLTELLPGYSKPLHGPLIALDVGLGQIRRECSHFDEWLSKLEELSESQIEP